MELNRINNFLIDIGILVFSGLYYLFFTYHENTLLSACNSVTLTVILLLLDMCVPAYLVRLKFRILHFHSSKHRFLPVFLNFVVISSSTTLSFALPIFLKIYDYLNDFEFGLLLITGIVSVIIAIVKTDVSGNKNEEQSDFFLVWLITALILIVLGGLIYVLYFFSNAQVLYGVLTILGMIGSMIIFTALAMKISEKDYFQKPWIIHYVIPSWNILMVLLWQQLFNELLTEKNLVSSGAGTFLFIVSGILPFRIMVLLDPPVKVITVISGIVALSVFVFFSFF